MNKLIVYFGNGEYRAGYISYHDRILECFKSSSVFYLIFLGGFFVVLSFAFACSIITFILFFHLLEFRSRSKGYISYINRSNGRLKLIYFNKDKQYVAEDDAAAFCIEKKKVWYKINGGAPFLQIKYHHNVIVKQFIVKDVDETIIERMIEEFGRGLS